MTCHAFVLGAVLGAAEFDMARSRSRACGRTRERLPRQRFADLALPFEFMKPALNVLVSTGSTAGS